MNNVYKSVAGQKLTRYFSIKAVSMGGIYPRRGS
jgi:hypothetical protein